MSKEIREKIENFWYYYKFHTIIALVIIVFVLIIAKDIFTQTKYDGEIVIVSSSDILEEDILNMQEYLKDFYIDTNNDEEVNVLITPIFLNLEEEVFSEQSMVNQAKLASLMELSNSQIYIFDEINAKYFSLENGYILKEEKKILEDDALIKLFAKKSNYYLALRFMDDKYLKNEEDINKYKQSKKVMEILSRN